LKEAKEILDDNTIAKKTGLTKGEVEKLRND